MKKRIIGMILAMAMMFTLCITPAVASSYSPERLAQIAQLEKEITEMEVQMKAIGQSTAVLGKIVSTSPYYIVSGLTIGSTTLNGKNYNVIDNPQAGSTDMLGDYVGSHKYLGSITLSINGVSTACNHFGSMGEKWYTLSDEKFAKEKKLKELKANPDCMSASELGAYANGADNKIVMQIGNSNISAYGIPTTIDENKTAPVVVNGSTLLPIRAIIEASFGTVDWDASTETVKIVLSGKVVQLKNNSTTANVDGNTVAMSTPAQIINSRFMVPVRFVAENLGMSVDWKSDVQVVVISNPNYMNDLIKSKLTLSGGNYTYTDDGIGCSYSYPQEWGVPTITRGKYSEGLYVDKVMLSLSYAKLWIDCDFLPSETSVNKVRNLGSNYESVQLAEDNTGIEAIVRNTDAYSENTNNGEVLILGTNGYLIKFYWCLNTMDNGLSQTEAEVLNVVKTFTQQEAVG